MDFRMGDGVHALRAELRELVAEHVPPDFLGAFTDNPQDLATAQAFCRVLAERGLLCMAWPEEYGGRGASVWEQTAVREEMWSLHEPRGAQYMGVNWVGPTVMRHGTPDQQRKHLPPIARGEVIWCQGFSEPDAGSDLASLRTAARADGDGWRINGQKVWTSYATMAQWCFLLARTSTGEKKQQGLTIFLVPMSAAGIEVRPIRSMLGPHHLNEVFFDDVRVGPENVLGTVDEGWKVVQEVLAFERVGIARYARCERLLRTAPEALGEEWEALPAELRSRWARMLTHGRRARLMAYRVVSAQSRGRVNPRDAAAYRIAVTRLDQESAEVLREIVTLAPVAERFTRQVDEHWRYSQASTVASGSVEIQRTLLARALLTPDRIAPDRTREGVAHSAAGPVDIELSAEAEEYGRTALAAFENAGGDKILQKAEPEPGGREAVIGPVLERLGAWELDVRGVAAEGEAAAALCRAAGYWALPYPVAERLARPLDLDVDGLLVLTPQQPLAPVADLDLRWAAVTPTGVRYSATPAARRSQIMATFDLTPLDAEGAADAAFGLVLTSWTLLGLLDRAIELACEHVKVRHQFGQALSRFQGVQFQLTDAEVERNGVEMLARYALWSVQNGRPGALADALALRLAAVEAADVVFRIAHQLHGATGFCDETTLSWISRYNQVYRRYPTGPSASLDGLLTALGRNSLDTP